MASVNIPYGGGSVSVNIPDFAMEGTQVDLLEQANRQTDALQKIAQSMGISVQNDQQETKSNKDLAAQIRKGNSESASGIARLNKSISSNLSPTALANSMMGARSGEESLSGLMGKDGLLGTLGLTMMGAQIGSLFGILEEFGSAMGALRRTGGGVSAELIELKTAAAAVGLDMQTLAKITVENGNAIRSLGSSTNDGTTNFLKLNSMLRESTRDMAFFGMSTKEMSSMLIDEIELRRSTRNEAFLEAGARDQMVNSMKENLKLNEVMASLTGQDVQDRIKARNEFRKNAIVAAAQSQMNQKQLDSQNALVDNLAGLGSAGAAGGPIQQALTNLIAGIPMDKFNDSFTQLSAAASAEGIDLRANLEQFASMVDAGADPEAMMAASQKLINQFANIDVDGNILSRAGAGQEGAMLLLTARQEAFASRVNEGETVQQSVNNTMTQFEIDVAAGAAALSGMASQINVATTTLQETISKSMLLAFNADPSNPGGIADFINNLEKLPSSQEFQAMTNLVTEIATLASGAQGMTSFFGIGNENKGDFEKFAEQGLTIKALAESLDLNITTLTSILSGKGQGGGPSAGTLLTAAGIATAMAGAFKRNDPETYLPVVIMEFARGLDPRLLGNDPPGSSN